MTNQATEQERITRALSYKRALEYEVRMFVAAVPRTLDLENGLEHDVWLECAVLHMRNLCEFLLNSGAGRSDTFYATDFLEQTAGAEWERAHPRPYPSRR